MIYLASSAFFYVIGIIIIGFGHKMLSWSKASFSSYLEKSVFAYGLGFGALSYAILASGIFKALYAETILSILLVMAIISAREIVNLHKLMWNAVKGIRGSGSFGLYLVSILFAAILLMYLGSMAPSYSNDSMVYHLKDAKYFANTHYIGLIPHDSTNALWPYLVEMYFTLALLFKLPPMAGLFHLSLAIGAAVGIYAFCKRYFSAKIGLLASTVFMLTPGIFMEARETYVDLGMVFFAFMAFYAFSVWLDEKRTFWIGLSGAMCGLAISVKYFIIIVPIILGTYILCISLRDRTLKHLTTFSICLFLASFVWYMRQYIALGNPTFPFFSKIFGTSGLGMRVMEVLSEKSIRDSYGLGISLKSFLILPWQITIFPGKFGGEQLGPIFLAVIPAIVLIRPVDRNIKRIFIFLFAYFVLWFFGYQNLRFLLPIAPLLSIAVAYIVYGLNGVANSLFSNFIRAAVSAILAASLALCIYHNAEGIKVVLGLDNQDNYLARNERSYEISKYINKNLPENSKLLVVNEWHTFFIDRDNRRELYYWIYTRYDDKYKNPGEIIDFFKREGFTHILYAYDKDSIGLMDEGLLSLMRRDEFVKNHLKLIYEQAPSSRNANGIEYKVYKI